MHQAVALRAGFVAIVAPDLLPSERFEHFSSDAVDDEIVRRGFAFGPATLRKSLKMRAAIAEVDQDWLDESHCIS